MAREVLLAYLARLDVQGEYNMPVCKECGEEVDELVKVKVDGRVKKLCEECADREREKSEVAEQSETVVQGMMGFKGRR